MMNISCRILLLLLSLGLYAPGFCETSALLEYRLKPGETFTVVQVQDTTDHNNGANPEYSKAVVQRQIEVEKVYPDGSMGLAIRLTDVTRNFYDEEGELTGTLGLTTTPLLSSLAGLFKSPIRIKISKTGNILSVTGISDEAMDAFYNSLAQRTDSAQTRSQVDLLVDWALSEESLRASFQKILPVYPQHPVAVGEQWTFPSQGSNEGFRIAETILFQLDGLNPKNTTATLAYHTTLDELTSKLNSLTFESDDMRCEGMYDIDMKTGLPTRVKLSEHTVVTSYQTALSGEKSMVFAQDTQTQQEIFVQATSAPPLDKALLEKPPVNRQPPLLEPLALESLKDYANTITKLRVYGDTKKAEQLTQEAFEKFHKELTEVENGRISFISFSYLMAIRELTDSKKFQKADRLLQEALAKFKIDEIGPNGHFQFSWVQYEIEMMLGRYTEAEKTILALLSKFEPLRPEYEKMGNMAKYNEMILFVRKNLSEVYEHQGKYPNAHAILDQLQSDFEKAHDELGLSLVYYRRGHLYTAQKQYAQAETYLKKYLQDYQKHNGDQDSAIMPQKLTLCEALVGLKNYKDAEATCQAVKDFYLKDNPNYVVEVDLFIAKTYMGLGRSVEAKKLIESSIELLEFMLPLMSQRNGTDFVAVEKTRNTLADFKHMKSKIP